MEAAQLIIEVQAGIITGTAMPELTRSWGFTSTDWAALNGEDKEAKEQARELWIRIAGESREYAESLENPAQVNWVRRSWLWL